jgi:hypothetical protein
MFYYVNPMPNGILTLLEELDSFQLHITQLKNRLQQEAMLKIPEVMKNLKLIIEFSDCLVEAKDLLSYDMVIDEDQNRKYLAMLKDLQNRTSLQETTQIEGT